jgi:Domain of unknown function (DUF1707)
MDTSDPSQLRISDADRHQVAEVLREAAGEGRIDLDELDERLEAAYAARTYADLVPITVDLPAAAATHLPTRLSAGHIAGAAAARPAPVVPGPAEERHVAILSGLDRKGVWVVPQHLTVLAFMGGVDLDLREAQFAGREVTITINAFLGGADITVNPHTHVIVEGTGIMGGYSGPSERAPAELDADSPIVRIRGVAILGGVSVTRKPART